MKSFPDEAEITVQAGAGGSGCVSFRRARFQPRGRPDGGNGGAGGDVILEASRHELTLATFLRRRLFQAANGRPGQGQDRVGKNGATLVIPVPRGTLVYDLDSGKLLGELLDAGHRLVAAKGGRGGKGNAHFTSSRMRSPRFAQPGEEGQSRRLRLELQLLADVGLMGPPNAGKTTLLKALTASRARVGDFPFTTLTPQLGVLYPDVEQEPLVLAEIPGLIPDAHKGKGLGHRFLRHLRRTRLLLVVMDLTQVDPDKPLAPLKALEREMQAFDPALLTRPSRLALNKMDLLPPDFPLDQVVTAYRQAGAEPLVISAHTGEGLSELRRVLSEAAAWQPEDADTKERESE